MLPMQKVSSMSVPFINSANSFRQRASPNLPPRSKPHVFVTQKHSHNQRCSAAILTGKLADVGGHGGGNNRVNKPTAEDSSGDNFFEHNALVDVLVKVKPFGSFFFQNGFLYLGRRGTLRAPERFAGRAI